MSQKIKSLDHLAKGLFFAFIAAIIFAMKHDPEHTLAVFSADFLQPLLNYFKESRLLWNSTMVFFFAFCACLKFTLATLEYITNNRREVS
ncbi:hypothetical protein [Endozoicomonas sp. Mp262]|uniref:hypothetical protein n=1 Tax=Endozoicomonas sp. Mp262 TaxID=2919499 RepID=UPI0021DB3F96